MTSTEIKFYDLIKRHVEVIPQDKRFYKCGGKGSTGIVMDFSVPEAKLCVELDGWGHTEERDHARDKWLLSQHGWKTLRFKNEDAIHKFDDMLITIRGAIACR
jgi:hypothetical protein